MDEAEEGIDKQDVLREIASALPMEEAPLPDLPPPEPEPEPQPELPPEPLPEPLQEYPSEPPPEEFPPPPPAAEPEALPRPMSSRALPAPTWWSRHRDEVAGLVTASVALVWISLGIAARAWMPSLVGVSFAIGALLIGFQAIWPGD